MRHRIYLIFAMMGIVFSAIARDHSTAGKIIVDAGGKGDPVHDTTKP